MSEYKINALHEYAEMNLAMLKYLSNKGFTIDRFGHAIKTVNKIKYRIKFTARLIRLESSGKKWYRLKSIYYSHIMDNVGLFYGLAIVTCQSDDNR